MRTDLWHRRSLIAAGSVLGLGLMSKPLHLIVPAQARSLAPTQTMRGGSNNYRPNAPLVKSLGSGFVVSGLVRQAGNGASLKGVRIQIWAATTLGGEREPRNHGSVLTASDGSFRLEMEQIVPNFGQPHAHLAYDDGVFQTVFLRPVMGSARDTSLRTEFILAPV
ncbi:twin-arginine translocation pathway signal [Paracoccus aestuariivivens]|uniref:Twin-arginine translocation pathway signal n=1 Tax=Paracoccus aestuariivivens TaxID=1820333 RepID=A0A6L6JDD6_9RHOB|nr:twin-arginine translocation pathway signal [Paracoccus aestuariivivens]MTH77921.1 twin-arginine translocation pathway signal [Paracoccus aestuariivivens]